MRCADFKRWLSPYIDALLSAQERATLEEHLKGCGACRTDLDSLREMMRSLRAMEPPQAPELLPGIHAKLQRQPWWEPLARRFAAPWPASLPLHSLALATTALLVIVVASLPQFAQVPRKSLTQLASKASDEIGDQFRRRDQGYEPYYRTVGNFTVNKRKVAARGIGADREIQERRAESVERMPAGPVSEFQGGVEGRAALSDYARRALRTGLEVDDKRVQPAAGAPFEVKLAEVLKNEKTAAFDRMASPASKEPQVAALLASSTVDNARLTMSAPSQPALEQEASTPLPQAPASLEKAPETISMSSVVSVSTSAGAIPRGVEQSQGMGVEEGAALSTSLPGQTLAAQPTEAPRLPVGLLADQAVDGFGAVGGASAGAAVTCPPCAKKQAELAMQRARDVHQPLAVQWKVKDLRSSVVELDVWVLSKGGSVVAIDDHHLSVTIPEDDAPQFLFQFSSGLPAPAPAAPPATPPPSPQAAGTASGPPRWVTISLELVPAQ